MVVVGHLVHKYNKILYPVHHGGHGSPRKSKSEGGWCAGVSSRRNTGISVWSSMEHEAWSPYPRLLCVYGWHVSITRRFQICMLQYLIHQGGCPLGMQPPICAMPFPIPCVKSQLHKVREPYACMHRPPHGGGGNSAWCAWLDTCKLVGFKKSQIQLSSRSWIAISAPRARSSRHHLRPGSS